MEIKKPDYPKMLIAYIQSHYGDIPEEEKRVNTKEEADVWIAAQQKLNRLIKERPFTKEERKLLPFPERYLVGIPRWVYLIGGFGLGLLIGKLT
jgi:hypothetical protein